MKLCMIGTGYVGLVSGVCFSDLGDDVICVDRDINKINSLKKAVNDSDIIFICVGTPTKKGGSSADLSQVYNVAKEISS